MSGEMTEVSLVDYLVLGERPHLIAHECTGCAARYFDHRDACAGCGAASFVDVPISTDGEVRSFTIVWIAAPGVKVPFVAAVVDCGGTSVRGNLINVEADPEHVRIGMPVQLATYVLGRDSTGAKAVGFGFEPQREVETVHV